MPGQKSVVWTNDNRVKLLDALLALQNIKVGRDTCGMIAAYVGDGCTAKAVEAFFVQIGRRKRKEVVEAIREVLPGVPIEDNPNPVPRTSRKQPPPGLSTSIRTSGVTKPKTPTKPKKISLAKTKALEEAAMAGVKNGTPDSQTTFNSELNGTSTKVGKVQAEPSSPITPESPGTPIARPRREKTALINYKTLVGLDSDDDKGEVFSEGSKRTDAEFDIKLYEANGGDGDDFVEVMEQDIEE